MKKKMNLLMLSIMICMVSCQKEEFQHSTSIENSRIHSRNFEDLCFTSYNVAAFCEEGLFGINTHNTIDDNPEEYGQSICDVLNIIDSDVINLQEVWCADVQEAIMDCIGDDYIDFVYDEDSGLLTISKIAFVEEEVVNFTGPETGLDQLKEKGFISVQIKSDCCSFNIMNTHLQADLGTADEIYNFTRWLSTKGLLPNTSNTTSVRNEQLFQIQTHLNAFSDCVPTIIGGDFNIDVGTDEFQDLITLIQGQPTQLITSSPTSINSGTTLDYFILSNYESHEDNIGEMTTTVFDCTDAEAIVRWNVMESDLNDEPPHTYILASFETAAEAHDYVDQLNSQPGPTNLIIQWVIKEVTETCRIHNESDHHPIETCIDQYDCTEQLECLEDLLNAPCDPPCEENFQCIHGHCQEIFDGGCFPPCNDTEQCVNGNCVPL